MRIDIRKAAEQLGLSEQEVTDIYRLFMQECMDLLPQLEEAIRGNHEVQVQNILHTLKGTGANLYAQDIVNAVDKIDDYYKTGDIQMALFVTTGIVQSIRELAQELLSTGR